MRKLVAPSTCCARCKKPIYRDSDGWWHFWAADWGNPHCLTVVIEETANG